MFRRECLLCGSGALAEVIDLGMHPMADTFIPESRLSEPDRLYPLIVDLCEPCGQIQLRTVTSPSERYAEVDYSYTSSNSSTSRRHWTEYSDHVSRETGVSFGDVVVEIGSNDGYLSAEFLKRGCWVQGVDPSPAMATLADAREVNTFIGLFDSRTAEELVRTLPARPTLIVANNVFNHSNDPLDFATGIRRLLAPNGTFVFELPYWGNLVEQGTFDQIYHEHVTYLTVTNAVTLFKRIGMFVVGVETVDYHGGSIRVYVRHHQEFASASPALAQAVNVLLEREDTQRLFKAETYRAFRRQVRRQRDAFLERLYHVENAGHEIVCIGAAAKGNTFLNYYKLGAGTVACVTDASAQKIGKYTPGTRIPIKDDSTLADYRRPYAIVTSWNIESVLRQNLATINPHIEYFKPYGGGDLAHTVAANPASIAANSGQARQAAASGQRDVIDRDAERICERVDLDGLSGRRVLITGASGLLGTYFLACLTMLKERGCEIDVQVQLLSDPPSHVASLMERSGAAAIRADLASFHDYDQLPEADVIVHAAGYAQPLRFMANPGGTLQIGSAATLALLQRLRPGGHFLFCSSVQVYGGLDHATCTEDVIGTATPAHPRASYVEGKRAGETACHAFRRAGVHATVARLGNVYGPGTRRHDKRVLNEFVEQALTTREIRMLDAGRAERTYCYVTDAVERLWQILLSGRDTVYNVGGRRVTTIAEVAQLIARLTGATVVPGPPAAGVEGIAGAPEALQFDLTRVEREFGSQAPVDLEDGLSATIEWQRTLYRR